MLTPFYAALFSMMLISLSVRTLRLRRQYQAAIGPSNEPLLERAVRAHANFCEYVPMALIGLYFFESLWGAGWWIHGLGLTLLAGRISHAYGVSQVREDYRFRVFGMSATFAVLSIQAFGILAFYAASPVI